MWSRTTQAFVLQPKYPRITLMLQTRTIPDDLSESEHYRLIRGYFQTLPSILNGKQKIREQEKKSGVTCGPFWFNLEMNRPSAHHRFNDCASYISTNMGVTQTAHPMFSYL